MILDWKNQETPRGRLFDANGNEIESSVFWCDTETGEVWSHVRDSRGLLQMSADKTGIISQIEFHPAPLQFVRAEPQIEADEPTLVSR